MYALNHPEKEHDFSYLKDRYLDFTEVGKGGMGHVYRAYDQFLRKYVAIKVLEGENATDKHIVRFHKEARLTSRLNHQNIVKVLDFGVGNDSEFYLIMDFVEGESLQEYLDRDGPLSLTRALSFAIQICEALLHAHNNQVVHRDIKPSNIMLEACERGEPTVKIVDFGLAKQEAENSGYVSQGTTMGTPLYISPEQVKNQNIDHRCDIYSVGCVIYTMLCGKPPFRGRNALETFDMHVNQETPPLTNVLDGELREVVEDIIAKAMMKAPKDRYQNLGSLIEDLREILLEETLEFKPEDDLNYKINLGYIGAFSKTRIGAVLICSLILCLSIGAYLYKTLDRSPLVNRPSAPLSTVPLGDIPGSTIFKIRKNGKYALVGTCDMQDSDLATLKDEYISHLELRGMSMNGSGLKYLAGKTINTVVIRDTHIKEEYISDLGAIKGMISLDLGFSDVGDRGLAKLPVMPALTTLTLSGCKGITNRSVSFIVEHFPNLSSLGLSNTGVDGASLVQMQKLKGLRHLALANLNLTDSDLVKLISLKKLNALDVSNNRTLTGLGLQELYKAANLKALKLSGCMLISHESVLEFERNRPECAISLKEVSMTADEVEIAKIFAGIIGNE